MSARAVLLLSVVVAAGLVAGLLVSLGTRDERGAATAGAPSAATPEARGPAELAAGQPAPPPVDGAVRSGVQPVPAAVAETAPEPARLDPRETSVIGRVVGEDRAPLAGARVALEGVLDSGMGLFEVRALGRIAWQSEVLAGEDGRFAADGIPAHGLELHLEVEAPGRPVLDLPALLAIPGEVTDLGDLVVPRGGTVRGNAVDELGNPVAGAPVVWTRAFGGDWSFLQSFALGAPAGRTDAQGAFEASGLPPGLVALAVQSEQGSAAWSLPLRLASDQLLEGIELTVLRGRPIRGRIVASEGGSVAGARVVARPLGPGPVTLEGESGEDGSFALLGGAPGQRYTLSVAAAGHRDGRIGDYRLPPPAEPDDLVEIELFPAVDVRISVRDAATGVPVEGSSVAWAGHRSTVSLGGEERNGLRFGDARALGRTDAQGELLLAGVRSFSRALLVRAEGFAPASVPLGRSNDDPDSSPIELLVRLEGGAALTVRVRDYAGPVAGAEVELRQSQVNSVSSRNADPAGVPDPHGLSRPLLLRGRTGPDGACTFEHLPPDGYAVAARAEGHARSLSEPVAVELGFASFELPLYLPRSAALRGRVLVHGAPVPNQAVLAIAADGATHLSIADAEGRYALEELPPGEVVAGAWERLPVSGLELLLGSTTREKGDRREVLELVEGEQRALDLEGESPGVTLSGTLLLNHEARPGAIVRAEELAEDSEPGGAPGGWLLHLGGAQATTGPDGAFAVTGLKPGRYRVSAELTDARGARLRVAQMEVEIGDADLARDLAGAVTGLAVELVMPDEAQPPRRMAVVLWPDEEQGGVLGFSPQERWSMLVGRNLRAEAGLLPEGDYWLEVRGRTYFSPPRQLALRAGRSEELEIVLDKRGG